MLYVRVEIWPFGDRSKSRCIGEATVGNVGGPDDASNYTGSVDGRPVRVTGFDRSLGAWALIWRVIEAAGLHGRGMT